MKEGESIVDHAHDHISPHRPGLHSNRLYRSRPSN